MKLDKNRILVEFCEVVKANIREIDIFARWGGEEFVEILGDRSKKDSLLVLERIRRGIEIFNFTKVGKVTCSIGSIDNEKNLPKDMFAKADEALYIAKKTGRNKIVAWEKS